MVGCWHGYLSGAKVPAYPGRPGKRAIKRVVCVCVRSSSHDRKRRFSADAPRAFVGNDNVVGDVRSAKQSRAMTSGHAGDVAMTSSAAGDVTGVWPGGGLPSAGPESAAAGVTTWLTAAAEQTLPAAAAAAVVAAAAAELTRHQPSYS